MRRLADDEAAAGVRGSAEEVLALAGLGRVRRCRQRGRTLPRPGWRGGDRCLVRSGILAP